MRGQRYAASIFRRKVSVKTVIEDKKRCNIAAVWKTGVSVRGVESMRQRALNSVSGQYIMNIEKLRQRQFMALRDTFRTNT